MQMMVRRAAKRLCFSLSLRWPNSCKMFWDTPDTAASIWLSAVDIVAARMPARMSPARRCLPVRMKKMMKIKKMTDYFAASPSGKMILFTKKKMTIEMPPLSTVVPML